MLASRQTSSSENFNSIKVRLKRYPERRHRCCHRHFNSIKVRLKLNAAVNSIYIRLFQFHKGTIKTIDEIIVKMEMYDISIP